ncbi:MAG: chorismate synthase [Actinobacteria bacterium]|nr:chorismate synthase [Actinomycetota bacterium]
MSSEYGTKLKVSVFGESHGSAIGVVINGLPAGYKIETDELMKLMDRRRPGANNLVTPRKERDVPVFLSGLKDSVTCGSPLCAMIENHDAHSSDYSALLDTPRPSHADYTAAVAFKGHADMRGGGHFSGRLTAPLCIAGGIAMQILAHHGIYIGAHISSIGSIDDVAFPTVGLTREILVSAGKKGFPTLDDSRGSSMRSEIESAASDNDSIGGVIECAAIGVPVGLGEPMFDGVENRLSSALFGIPAVKGVEFGAGFKSAKMRGSQHNDAFLIESDRITTETNNHGGVLGGITSGMPILLRVAIKPTPSIGKEQRTISLSRFESTTLSISGRHDPCIAIRAVPCVEAVVATVILDLLLEGTHNGNL